MNKNFNEEKAKKAESWQGLKAFLIPLTLFLACVGAAAGTFLIRYRESVGWVFIAVSATTIILDFIGLIRFQNQWRAKGIIPGQENNEL